MSADLSFTTHRRHRGVAGISVCVLELYGLLLLPVVV